MFFKLGITNGHNVSLFPITLLEVRVGMKYKRRYALGVIIVIVING